MAQCQATGLFLMTSFDRAAGEVCLTLVGDDGSVVDRGYVRADRYDLEELESAWLDGIS